MKKLLFIFILIYVSKAGFSQAITKSIVDTSRASTYLTFAAPAHNSGFVLLGSLDDNTFLNISYIISKLDKNGEIISCVANDSLYLRSFILTSDQGYLFTGIAGNLQYDQCIIKTDSLFNLEWIKLLRPDSCFSTLPTYTIEIEDKYYFCTFSYCPGNSITILKLSNNGDILDQIAFSDTINHIIWDYKISGINNSQFAITYDDWNQTALIVVDTNLNVSWAKIIKGNSAYSPHSLLKLSDSSILITGFTHTAYAVYKFSNSGNVIFSRTLHSSTTDLGLILPVEMENNSIGLSGSLQDSNQIGTPLFIKLDSSGNLISAYQNNFSQTSNTFAFPYFDSQIDTLYLFGMYQNFWGIPLSQIIFIRSNTNCDDLCFNEPATIIDSIVMIEDSFFTPLVTHSNFFLIDTISSFTISSLFTRDLCSWLSDKESPKILISHPGFQISPNPFHTSTWLQVTSEFASANLNIFDAKGSLIRAERISNQKTYVLNRNELQNGIYFLQLVNESGQMMNAKIVVE
ncbi:MAG: T9SS type A sorting domain-containing protein [Bacteroidetes bacterium]|nr:T9SS type A sorting domain-containing protein [Bacteroidota bacterium]MBL0139148.1 T9SS type A sorting domain-containing protein [Bacteroidota bacterium]